MHYTLHQLTIFTKICELGSITKAAEELNLTQPAVSIQLKNLQDQFSIPLTEVIGRKLYVTDFGKEIADSAISILDQVDAINYKTMAYKGQLSGRLKLSVVSTGKYVMPYFLTEFLHQHNGVDLIMDVTNKTQVINALENNEVDFALVSVVPQHLALERIPLMNNRLFLVGAPGLTANKRMNKKQFAKYPLIYREDGSATRDAMEKFISSKDISTFKKIQLTSNEALKQALIAGLGYSIMPLIGIKNALFNGDIEIIPYKGLPIVTKWELIWLKSKKLSPTAEAFVRHIKTEKDRIIQEKFEWINAYEKP